MSGWAARGSAAARRGRGDRGNQLSRLQVCPWLDLASGLPLLQCLSLKDHFGGSPNTNVYVRYPYLMTLNGDVISIWFICLQNVIVNVGSNPLWAGFVVFEHGWGKVHTKFGQKISRYAPQGAASSTPCRNNQRNPVQQRGLVLGTHHVLTPPVHVPSLRRGALKKASVSRPAWTGDGANTRLQCAAPALHGAAVTPFRR